MESTFIDTITRKKKIIFNAGAEASIDYIENKTTYVPTIQLLFSPFGLPFVPIEILGTDTNKIISSMAWTKDRNNPGGMCSFEIVPDTDTILGIVNVIKKFSPNLYSQIWNQLGVDLEDLFKPMTLCQLWIDGYFVMIGTVRSCKRNASVTNEDKNVSYTLTVDELGNMYNLATASLDLIIADGMQTQIVDAMKAALEMVGIVKGVSLAVGIQAILKAFAISSLTQGVRCSDAFPLSFRLRSEANPLGGISNLSFANFMTVDENVFELNSGAGMNSIWSFIKGYVPSPWMELFTESGGRTIVTDGLGIPSVLFPGFNYVVARTVPYSNPLLGTVNPVHLPSVLPYDLTAVQMLIGGDFIIITDDMIHEKSLGFDCSNQNTVFHTRYASKAMGGGTQDLSDKGIKSVGPFNPFASGGVKTYGVREMFESIDCTNFLGLGTGSSYVERIAKNFFGAPGLLSKNQLSNLLAVWFRNQSKFREGIIVTRCIPYARVGMYCLYLPSMSNKKVENIRDIGIYYIDSLSHEYTLENENVTYTTTLNVIRGVPIPMSVIQTALLLFDFEILPPISGLVDGEYKALKAMQDAMRFAQ
jgi:hypothetical protein